jgi:uncharacterized membrane protein YqiK
MKDPLFKPIEDPLTPEEEAEITRRLAEAYRKHEEAEKKPELQRILQLVAEGLASEFSDASSPKQHNH